MSGDEVGRNNVMECNANNINSVIHHALLMITRTWVEIKRCSVPNEHVAIGSICKTFCP